MYLHDKLLAKKHYYELAMQSALQDWQRDPIEFKCPGCGSKKIATRPRLRGKNPWWCPICKCHFDQPIEFACNCTEPGSQSKCHDCPNFHKLLVSVKAIAEDLQSRNLEQTQPGSSS